jgi:hypothetical protein
LGPVNTELHTARCRNCGQPRATVFLTIMDGNWYCRDLCADYARAVTERQHEQAVANLNR